MAVWLIFNFSRNSTFSLRMSLFFFWRISIFLSTAAAIFRQTLTPSSESLIESFPFPMDKRTTSSSEEIFSTFSTASCFWSFRFLISFVLTSTSNLIFLLASSVIFFFFILNLNYILIINCMFLSLLPFIWNDSDSDREKWKIGHNWKGVTGATSDGHTRHLNQFIHTSCECQRGQWHWITIYLLTRSAFKLLKLCRPPLPPWP